MKTRQLIIPFFFFFLLITTVSATTDDAPGDLPPSEASEHFVAGYTPIKNLSEPHVIEVALFAVKEHNKLKQGKPHMLKLLNILKGWSQVVSGINYRFIITATPLTGGDGTARQYEALVYERPWQHVMNLNSFNVIQ